MNKLAMATAAAFALAWAPAAQATVYHVGDPNFQITNGTPFTPSITALFFASFGATGAFDDTFEFTIPQNGFGSGSISTSFSNGSTNKLVITDLIINGVSYALIDEPNGQSRSVGGIPIFAFGLNTIQVKGNVTGSGLYTGTATFTAVPEPAQWAMMVGGFAVLGAAVRRRSVRVAFS
ncbi:FxDxF family PEP-CTERM protein [Sphingobium nicotianae]|uniref:PEP-CTERM sorting domain-containing protein n=1 Tax=Sphingobium nicotianae TaxID=2782607 RepID=A0A9X1DEU0_9SPHN|nr:FxDxF family PEP-CTERM protein [Sphingobium nicotianae]MBT2188897.1 PEP-CTERM sorting domain-containing protein [Sphingobium nicotianae]